VPGKAAFENFLSGNPSVQILPTESSDILRLKVEGSDFDRTRIGEVFHSLPKLRLAR
jgi:hypothetical protein